MLSTAWLSGCGPTSSDSAPATPPASTSDPGFDDMALVADLDALLSAAQIEYGIPVVALAVVAHGEVIYAKTFELDESGTHTQASPREYLFPLASTSKTLSALAVALALEDGALEWDSTLASLMPEFTPPGDWPSPTLAALLSHQSGFMRMGAVWGDGQRTLDEVIETVSHAAPLRAPDQAFEYNNVMFTIGVVATARADKLEWSQMLTQRVLKPLGMLHTYLPGDPAISGTTVLPGYFPDPASGGLAQAPFVDRSNVGPAGGIHASLADIARWTLFVANRGELDGERVVAEDTLETLWQPRVWAWPGTAYGLGWFIQSWHGRRMVTHDGNLDSGYSSSFAVLPDNGVGFVLLSNVSDSPLQAEIAQMVFGGLESSRPPEPGWTVPLPLPEIAQPPAITDLPPIELAAPTQGMTADGWLTKLREPDQRKRALVRLWRVQLVGHTKLIHLGSVGRTSLRFMGTDDYERSTELREIVLAKLGYREDETWYALHDAPNTPVADPVLAAAVRGTSYVSLHADLLAAFPEREVLGQFDHSELGACVLVRLSNPAGPFEIFVEIELAHADVVGMWEHEGGWIHTQYEQFVDIGGLRLPMRERVHSPILGRIETTLARTVDGR
jgi:CubicO group peptidase (beta-lactamase class C family)